MVELFLCHREWSKQREKIVNLGADNKPGNCKRDLIACIDRSADDFPPHSFDKTQLKHLLLSNWVAQTGWLKFQAINGGQIYCSPVFFFFLSFEIILNIAMDLFLNMCTSKTNSARLLFTARHDSKVFQSCTESKSAAFSGSHLTPGFKNKFLINIYAYNEGLAKFVSDVS